VCDECSCSGCCSVDGLCAKADEEDEEDEEEAEMGGVVTGGGMYRRGVELVRMPSLHYQS
jgi:hypothetical protein